MIRVIRAGLVAATAAAALALAGCGGAAAGPSPAGTPSQAGGGGTASQRVTIEGTNMLRFTPATVHVPTGTVRITLKDMGAYPHNIVIPGLKVTSPTVTGDPGGMTVAFTVRFPHRGRYPFHCQFHATSGMIGVFVAS